MEVLGYFASLFIGISLGLIGGGGSILTVPILVYLFNVNPKLATTYSLFIVGLTAAFGAIRHYKMGNIKVKSAVYFAIPSLITLLLVRKIVLLRIPEIITITENYSVKRGMVIMVLFAILMVLASYSMIRTQKSIFNENQIKPLHLMFIGAAVGIITGFLGAGGGFLIIPALLFFAKMQMKQAVGTSLLIIGFNSLLGFLGDVINGVEMDYIFLLSIAFIAGIGIFIGTFLSKKMDGAQLKPIFGWFVLVMGIYIIAKELFL
ncbi:sulfite exporter TauE/SafE family protein [Flavobacterium antarcticum]|uniref:sulfite exporter TauE/SafE family protein n=1 Tax=Flavobacterium antarcticum TaxID=271155 RepID=UPI0003B4E949|nr:sulfite exporter TauE/SafE family protein [Flavobacterium antarcticum]